MERTHTPPCLPSASSASSPSSSNNNNKKKKDDRKGPDYQILVEEFCNTVSGLLRAIHKDAYPLEYHPGHSRWKKAILEKLGEGLTMEDKYNRLFDIFSDITEKNEIRKNASSTSTFKELLSILENSKARAQAKTPVRAYPILNLVPSSEISASASSDAEYDSSYDYESYYAAAIQVGVATSSFPLVLMLAELLSVKAPRRIRSHTNPIAPVGLEAIPDYRFALAERL
ncbi:hypothetical protein RIF29_43642 [Crotalaria pallida]|uniref:Uncharacterized protein n=1 Tax=Crotalaria pallida TaxID=3830 RepID=A0AAN9DYN5_CROPI